MMMMTYPVRDVIKSAFFTIISPWPQVVSTFSGEPSHERTLVPNISGEGFPLQGGAEAYEWWYLLYDDVLEVWGEMFLFHILCRILMCAKVEPADNLIFYSNKISDYL